MVPSIGPCPMLALRTEQAEYDFSYSHHAVSNKTRASFLMLRKRQANLERSYDLELGPSPWLSLRSLHATILLPESPRTSQGCEVTRSSNMKIVRTNFTCHRTGIASTISPSSSLPVSAFSPERKPPHGPLTLQRKEANNPIRSLFADRL